MKKFRNILLGHFYVPGTKKTERIIRSMTPTEWLVFYIFSILLFLSTVLMLGILNNTLIETVPAPGGRFTEGMIGNPRFINPLLATTNPDESMSSLVYSGLMKRGSEGKLIADLAESYEISNNETTYTFKIRDDVFFHDGRPVTADDVIFTIEKVLDERVKSPQRPAWSGIGVEKISNKEVRFLLNEPFNAFLRNTTIGILPKHLWSDVAAEQIPFSNLNIEPVGAGPYQVKSYTTNDSGVPESYRLESFKDYYGEGPYIDEIVFKFYKNMENLISAYASDEIESLTEIPSGEIKGLLKSNTRVLTKPTPRIFGLFFNQNKNDALFEKSARRAIRAAINKEDITDEVLAGFATTASSPFPNHFYEQFELEKEEHEDQEKPTEILEDGGWEFDEGRNHWILEEDDDIKELSLTLTTPNIRELQGVSNIILRDLEEVGIDVKLNSQNADSLVQEVIRPRNFEALLFGMIIIDPLDLFAFWHSSQRNDPGLNVSLYANLEVDKALREISRQVGEEEINENLKVIRDEIDDDIPAVFLYIPEFTYLAPNKINNIQIGIISKPVDRFSNIENWYIETNRIWKI